MMNPKLYVDIAAKKAANFDKILNEARHNIDAVSGAIHKMENQKDLINSFKETSNSVSEFSNKLKLSESNLKIATRLSDKSSIAYLNQKNTVDNLKNSLKPYGEQLKKGIKLSKDENAQYKKINLALTHNKKELTELSKINKNHQKELKKSKLIHSNNTESMNRQSSALSELKSNLNSAGIATDKLNDHQKRLEKNINKARIAAKRSDGFKRIASRNRDLRSGAMNQAAGLAATAYTFGKPAMTAVNFEESMAKVGALTFEGDLSNSKNSSNKNMLTSQARSLGRDTRYKASEVSEAMQFQAMAGFNPEQINQSTKGILNLTTAGMGSTTLAETADISTNILSSFKLEAKDMGKVGNILAGTFSSSNTNLQEMGEALKYVGATASDLGGTLPELSAMTGVLANNGIKASMAGTGMRAMFLRLSAPSKSAADWLKYFGVKTKTATGDLRKMPDMLAELSHHMSKLGKADRSRAIKDIFETEAATSASLLIQAAGSGKLQSYSNKIKKLGDETGKNTITNRIATQVNNTAAGSLKRLGSAVESLSISFGNTLLPVIRTGSKFIGDISKALDSFTEKNQTIAAVLGGTGLAMGALTAATIIGKFAFSGISDTINGASFVLKKLKITTLATKAAQLGLGIASKTMAYGVRLATGVTWLFNAAMAANPIGLVAVGIASVAGGAYLIYKNWGTIIPKIKALWNGFKDFFVGIGDKLFSPLSDKLAFFVDGFRKIKSFFSGDDTQSKIVPEIKKAQSISEEDNIIPFKAPSNNSETKTVVGDSTFNITIHAGNMSDPSELADQVKIAVEQALNERSLEKNNHLFDEVG